MVSSPSLQTPSNQGAIASDSARPTPLGLEVLNDMIQSAGDGRDLTQQQIPLLRQLFEDKDIGLFLFAQYIFGYRDLTAAVHLPMTRLLGRWGESVLNDGTTIDKPPV